MAGSLYIFQSRPDRAMRHEDQISFLRRHFTTVGRPYGAPQKDQPAAETPTFAIQMERLPE